MNHKLFPSFLARPAISLALLSLFGAGLAGAQATNVEEITYPDLPRAERPEPQRFELDNGMTVILIEDHELPLVEGQVAIRTGARDESADKIGLASLVGTVLRSGGTQSMGSDELDDWLEDRAARIETRISSTRGSASLSCLAKELPSLLPVVADLLRNPAFEEEKLNVAKTQQISGISRQNDSPQGILQREFREIVYGESSPYARNATYESIGNISRQDLTDWHAKYFHPERVILGLVGDFDTKKALELIRSAFGDWPRGPKLVSDAASYQKDPRAGVYFVEKNDVTQSNIQMGHLGIERDHPDYYAVEVMNQVLGGSFASRLFSNVRSKKGLAYGVRGRVGSNYDYPGLFSLFTSTKTETTGAAIDALLEEARNMTAQPPSPEEIRKAKASILNSFVFRSDTASEILSQQIEFEYFGYPLDWLNRYRQGIEAVGEEQVKAAAAKHIRLDEMAILVVGPAEGSDKPLEDFGTVKVVDISIPEPKVAAVQIDAAGRKRGAELVAKIVEAIGGADRLDRLSNLRTEGSVTAFGPQGEMELAINSTVVFPDRMASEVTLPFGKITQVVDGGKAFVLTPQGAQNLPDSQAKDLLERLQREPLYLLKQRGAEGFQAAVTGQSEVEGTQVELLYIELAGAGTTLGVDPATGTILSRSYQGANQAGAPGEIFETRSDFRPIDGLVLPFTTTTTFEGEPMTKSSTSNIELDVEVDESLFQQDE